LEYRIARRITLFSYALTMSIIRISKRDNPYAQIDKNCLEDKALSFRARGVLCYLLSKPDKWQIRVADLVNKTSKEGRESIQTALKELEKCGYLSKLRIKGEGGKFAGIDYEVREMPLKNADKPQAAKPDTAEPDTVEPEAANPLHSNNDSFSNNEVSNNKIEAACASLPAENKSTGEGDIGPKKEKDVGWQWWKDVYYKFLQRETGKEKPAVSSADYAGLKKMRKALTDQEGGEEPAQTELLYIFQNWAKLENYHQGRLRAYQINSELVNIQKRLRNPQLKVSSYASNQQNIPGKQVSGQSFDEIEARYQ
jgi:hypothetical protein